MRTGQGFKRYQNIVDKRRKVSRKRDRIKMPNNRGICFEMGIVIFMLRGRTYSLPDVPVALPPLVLPLVPLPLVEVPVVLLTKLVRAWYKSIRP